MASKPPSPSRAAAEDTATAQQSTVKTAERTYPFISRREIEALISEGRHIIIVDQYVLKVDAWVKYHPGGDKAIKHMIGRDATDEVNGLHSPEARAQMNRYRVGRIPGRWKNFLPPIQGGKFRPRGEEGEEWEEEPPEIRARAANYDEDTSFGSSSFASQAASTESERSRTPSPAPSPVFDDGESAPELNQLHARPNARSKSAVSRSDSFTSISSIEDEKASAKGADDGPRDGMAHLDALTRQEIRLDLDKYPPLDEGTQDTVIRKYRELNERIKAEGLYDCNYVAYAIEGFRYTLLFCGCLLFLKWGWYVPSAFCLGSFWHQLVFTAHDAGHMGITHHFHVDTVIGIIIADFIGGLSLGWWKRNHNVHHIITNSPEHDPDIEHLPFFAISHRFFTNLRSTYYDRVMEYDIFAKFFVSLQHYLYYIVMMFARLNLYRLSWEYLLKGQAPKHGPAWWHRHLELVGQVFFWYWFGYGIMYKAIDGNWNRFVFFMISHAVTSPLHVQITLSHFAMSTSDLGPHESFPQRMLRTTMDVDCPEWLDFFHGGLQFQAIHHLYPRIPRHNLRKTQKLVQDFCNDVGIPYALYGFVEGNKHVIGRLADVARQAAILRKCQQTIVDGSIGHSHAH